jgi:hypothetical protein
MFATAYLFPSSPASPLSHFFFCSKCIHAVLETMHRRHLHAITLHAQTFNEGNLNEIFPSVFIHKVHYLHPRIRSPLFNFLRDVSMNMKARRMQFSFYRSRFEVE